MVKNRIGKLCLAAAVAILLVLHCCVCAFALVPDLQRKCSVTFTLNYNNVPVAGGNLKMYRIATWTVRNGAYDFKWVSELADAGLNLADKDSEVFARHVSMLVESLSLPAAEQQIGEDGKAVFSDLDCGLYVVYQTKNAAGYEPINAYCISLPMLVDGELAYDLRAAPKPRPERPSHTDPGVTTPEETTHDVTTPGLTAPSETTPNVTTPDVTTPGVTTPGVTTPGLTLPESTTAPSTTNVAEFIPPKNQEPERLPETGQLWWPAWLLGAVGLILFGLGLTLRILYRDNAEESEA